MAIARITTIEWNSKETCDTREQDYVNNAPQEFPDASQLLFTRLNETTVMAVTLYPDEQTMQKADEARAKRLSIDESSRVSIETKVGSVTLNHHKS